MSYEVPSDEKRDRKTRLEIDRNRNLAKFSPTYSTQASQENIGTAVGGATATGVTLGGFVLDPELHIVGDQLSWTGGIGTLEIGDIVDSSTTAWQGKLLLITTGNSTAGTGVFEQQNATAFVDGAQTLTETPADWVGTYTNTSVVTGQLVITSASMIINDLSGSPTIKTIHGAKNDGQFTTLKPIEGKTLTVASGGNIDTTGFTVTDDVFATLQFHEDNITPDASGSWTVSLAVAGSGDNLGSHVATLALKMEDNAIFFDTALLKSIISSSTNINYVVDVDAGAHDFFVDDLVIPKFGITETSIESNVDFDMNGKSIGSSVAPATEIFQIIFDQDADSDTYISNSTGGTDRIDVFTDSINTFIHERGAIASLSQHGLVNNAGQKMQLNVADHWLYFADTVVPDDPVNNSEIRMFMDTADDILKIRKKDSVGALTTVSLEGGGSTDKIEELDSKVEVIDTGTGRVEFTLDGILRGTLTTPTWEFEKLDNPSTVTLFRNDATLINADPIGEIFADATTTGAGSQRRTFSAVRHIAKTVIDIVAKGQIDFNVLDDVGGVSLKTYLRIDGGSTGGEAIRAFKTLRTNAILPETGQPSIGSITEPYGDIYGRLYQLETDRSVLTNTSGIGHDIDTGTPANSFIWINQTETDGKFRLYMDEVLRVNFDFNKFGGISGLWDLTIDEARLILVGDNLNDTLEFYRLANDGVIDVGTSDSGVDGLLIKVDGITVWDMQDTLVAGEITTKCLQDLDMTTKDLIAVGDISATTGTITTLDTSLINSSITTSSFIDFTATANIDIKTTATGDDINIDAFNFLSLDGDQVLIDGTNGVTIDHTTGAQLIIGGASARFAGAPLILAGSADNIDFQTALAGGTLAAPTGDNIKIFNDSDTGELSVKKVGGAVVSLEGGGGGANTTLSNLTDTTAINKTLNLDNTVNIIPSTTLGSDLGDSTHEFGSIYGNNFFLSTNTHFKEVSSNMQIEVSVGNDIIIREGSVAFVTFNGGTNDIVFGSAYETEFNADVRMDGGNVFRSQDTQEIGFLVTNSTTAVGAQGTIQIPTKVATPSSASQADTDFGAIIGSLGMYQPAAGNPTMVVRDTDGTWSTEPFTNSGLT